MLLRRLMQLPAADIALAIEAACMLTFFRIALNFLPVQTLTAWMGKAQQSSLAGKRSRHKRCAALSGPLKQWFVTSP